MTRRHAERGAGLLWLFVAVALFGLLGYAFLNNSRVGLSWILDEQSKTAAAIGQDCSNSLDMAAKRLEARGCTGVVSYNVDGTPAPGGPADGSCSIYHPNGGGAKACGAPPAGGCGASPSIGQLCPDGTVYAGLSPDGNLPMFTTPSDAGGIPINNGNNGDWTDVAAYSTTSGSANTAAYVAADSDSATPGVQPHQAPSYCHSLTAHGHSDWYLPAEEEFDVLFTNHGQGSLEVNANWYWTSTEHWMASTGYRNGPAQGAGGGSGMKHFTNEVRCVRKGT